MSARDIESLSAAFEQHLWLLGMKLIASVTASVTPPDGDFEAVLNCMMQPCRNPYDELQPDPEAGPNPEVLAKLKRWVDGRSEEEAADALAKSNWAELRGHVAGALVNIAVAASSMKLDGTPADKLAVSIGGGRNAPRADEIYGTVILPVRTLLAKMRRISVSGDDRQVSLTEAGKILGATYDVLRQRAIRDSNPMPTEYIANTLVVRLGDARAELVMKPPQKSPAKRRPKQR